MALTSQEPGLARKRSLFVAILPLITAAVFFLSGCAAPGVPVTRGTTKPQKITDLAAQQAGSSIVLTFTLPTETTKGRALIGTPEIQIYRAFAKTQAGQRRRAPKLKRIATIRARAVQQNSEAGRVHLADPLTPEELAKYAGSDEAFYAVRARVERSSSEASNVVVVPVLPAPQPVNDLRALPSDKTVRLAWSAAGILPEGSPQPISMKYQIYRANAPSIAAASTSQSFALGTEFALLGESPQMAYSDTSVKPAQTYRYMVRAIAEYPAGSVQSVDSNVVEASLHTTSRPSAPANLIATLISGSGAGAPYIALSWAISTEPDVRSYNVYRSTERENVGTCVNSAPVLTPVFQDNSISPGYTYFYRITAINGAGEESDYSAAVQIAVPVSK